MFKIDQKILETYLKYMLGWSIAVPMHSFSQLSDVNFLLVAIYLGLGAGAVCALLVRTFVEKDKSGAWI